MKNVKKRLNTNIECESLRRIAPMFKSQNETVQYAIHAYSFLRNSSLREIRGKFKLEELRGIIEANRGKELTPDMKANPAILIENLKYHNQPSPNTKPISWKYNFSFDILIGKLRNLTSAQVYFMQEEIWRFWKYESRKVGALDDFIDFLIYGT